MVEYVLMSKDRDGEAPLMSSQESTARKALPKERGISIILSHFSHQEQSWQY